MGTDHFDKDTINNFNITRLGKEKTEYNRIVKFRLSSVNDRDKFLKNAKKLKDAPEPWGKVYIKKTNIHPVYFADNNQLRKKMCDLKKMPGYKNKYVCLLTSKLPHQSWYTIEVYPIPYVNRKVEKNNSKETYDWVAMK